MITVELVRRLVAEQFPQWSGLPVTPVPRGGVDNRTFRLGAAMSVRLPSHDRYATQVDKEQRWLPVLAPQLPLPIPEPMAKGVASQHFPHSWSIYRWLDGAPAEPDLIDDLSSFATDLGQFLVALRHVDATDGPAPGPHNFYRGGPLTTYDEETRRAIRELGDDIPTSVALAAWEQALASTWTGPPVWVHGDVAAGNLLVRDGRLSAVIDFGSSGVGDPACDTSIAWTLLDGPSRSAFRAAIDLDEATWARGRGWTLWKALITIAGAAREPASQPGSQPTSQPDWAGEARRVLDLVLDEHRQTR